MLCALAVSTPVTAIERTLLHATLLRSTPAANSRIAKFPEAVRLVFSEQIVPELSQITLVLSSGDSVRLKVANDPHDVHTLIGTGPADAAWPGGPSKIVWRVLSADGHPVGGIFSFTVTTGAVVASTTPVVTPAPIRPAPADTSAALIAAPATSPTAAAEEKPIPVMAALFRGVGLGAFMIGIGVLFFGLTAGERRTLIPGAVVTSLIAVGTLLLVAHAIAWVEHISPTNKPTGSFISSVLASNVGRVELARVVLAVLTLWGIALARHRKIALGLGIACIVLSGAVGHPAAIHPLLAIPTKSIHLLAASVWGGGLVWLLWVARQDMRACEIEARRVSSIALFAVIAILVTGLIQTVLFLNTPSDLFRYDYGKLVFNKIVGLLILIGFGAYHKFKLVPRVETAETQRKLSRSMKLELAIMTVVILLSGFVAYVPTPPAPQAAIPTTTENAP